MPALETLLAFIAASVAVTLSPGPDNLMVLAQGIARGQHAGLGIALGCALGCFTHTLWATLGVSALLLASPNAFMALKFAGATYLAWLGVQALRSRGTVDGAGAVVGRPVPWHRHVARGFIANAINPKVALVLPRLHAAVHRRGGDRQDARLPAARRLVRGAECGLSGRAGLSLDTQSTVILYNLGLAYLQTANFSQARSCFQQQTSGVDTMPELDLLIAKCWVQEQSLEKALASYQRYSEQAAEPTVQKEILLIKAAIFLPKNWYWLLGAFTLAVSLFVFLRSRKT